MNESVGSLHQHSDEEAAAVVLPFPSDRTGLAASEAEEQTPPPTEQAVNLTKPALAYIAAVFAGGLALIAFFAPQLDVADPKGLVAFFLIAVVAEKFEITVYGNSRISVAVVSGFAASLLYGPAGAAAIVPAATFLYDLIQPSPWYRRIFNVGVLTITYVCTALVFVGLFGKFGEVDGWLLPVALVAALVNYSINFGLLSVVISLTSDESPLAVWNEKFKWLFPHYLVMGLLGLALAVAYHALGIAGILAFVAPPAMMQFAFQQYLARTAENVERLRRKNAELEKANYDILQMTERLRETYDGTLEALVSALDARDRETKGHSLRVARYTMEVAKQLGVPEGSQEWVDIQRGALLHDVGKIGVSDLILHKPGPLTPEEWDDMKRHPHIGYDMLKEISFLSGAARMVMAHHERYDGKGYPNGLTGEEIPLGARVFVIADTFDAMTSDRPYRKALTPEVAREEILRNSGTQFDPKAVQAFLLVYERWVQDKRLETIREEAEAA